MRLNARQSNVLRQGRRVAIGVGVSAMLAVMLTAIPAEAQMAAPGGAHASGGTSGVGGVSGAGGAGAKSRSNTAKDANAIPASEEKLLGSPDDDDAYLQRFGGPDDTSAEPAGSLKDQPLTPTEALVAVDPTALAPLAASSAAGAAASNAAPALHKRATLSRKADFAGDVYTASGIYPGQSPPDPLVHAPLDSSTVYASPW